MAKQGKGSKTKGSGFERKIAKKLNDWWGGENVFYRVPASGGLRWGNRADTIGDIVTPKGFTHTIECKHNESLDYKHFFEMGVPNKNNIGGWWQQAVDEANRADRIPWLIIKRNYCKALLIFGVVDDWTYFYKDEVNQFVTTKFNIKLALPGYREVGIYFFEEFLGIANPEMFVDREIIYSG